MDIYKPIINKEASDAQLVKIGKIVGVIALVIATSLAKVMGEIDQMFQYIQEYTGLVSPGILAVFLMGLFWKKTNAKGAIIGVLASIPVALGLKLLAKATPTIGLPFMDQMLYTMLTTMVIIAGVSLTTNPNDDDPKAISLNSSFFKTSSEFNISAYVILLILAIVYTLFW